MLRFCCFPLLILKNMGYNSINLMNKIIPIEVSARHIHLSRKDLEALFGDGYQLKKIKDLTQPGDFAAEEALDVSSNGKEIENIRIVGPARKETQIELSMTDALHLGLKPEVRISGSIDGTQGIDIIGPKGGIKIQKGVIVAKRHIHCNLKEAKELGLKNKEIVSVKTEGERGLVFDNVEIRVDDKYKLVMHLDTDEGNASGINKKSKGLLIK